MQNYDKMNYDLDELSDLRNDQSAKDYNRNFINLDVFKKGLLYPFLVYSRE